jgi:hypothetical protein
MIIDHAEQGDKGKILTPPTSWVLTIRRGKKEGRLLACKDRAWRGTIGQSGQACLSRFNKDEAKL